AAVPATHAASLNTIKHIVIVMQENRSFDSYFGTFPGADGIPMRGGVPTVCVPDPAHHSCQRPYHNPSQSNVGGGHTQQAAIADINGGKMDGFVKYAQDHGRGCAAEVDPQCVGRTSTVDVMGYHDWHEIPNYWSYAKNYVLQDHMSEPVASWSLPAHLFAVSGWSATCPRSGPPTACTSAPGFPSK